MSSTHINGNAVPSYKKGYGAVSVVIFSDDFRSIVLMDDHEKSKEGYRRYAIPGGRKDPSVDYRELETAIRETEEEVGLKFKPSDLVQISWKRDFPDGTTHDFFCGMIPRTTMFRNSGTHEDVGEGVARTSKLVLGPPQWVSLEDVLAVPNKQGWPSHEKFLHFTHLQGVCESLFFLYAAKNLGKIYPPFKIAWEKFLSKDVFNLRARLRMT